MERCRLFAAAHGPVHDGGSDVEIDVAESLSTVSCTESPLRTNERCSAKACAVSQLRQKWISFGHRLWLVLAQEFLGLQRPHGQTLRSPMPPRKQRIGIIQVHFIRMVQSRTERWKETRLFGLEFIYG